MSDVLNIGQMDRKVRVERLVKTVLPSGQSKAAWELYSEWWCKVRADNANEGAEASQRTETRRYTMRGRFLPQVNGTMRINDADQIYHINGVLHEGRNAQTILSVTWRDSING